MDIGGEVFLSQVAMWLDKNPQSEHVGKLPCNTTIFSQTQQNKLFLLCLTKDTYSRPHYRIIGRLHSLGFSNDCLAWFTNFFSDRVQWVKSECLLSRPLAVSMGVPQGYILVPTLFSVYINDVALAAGDFLIHLYTDNTILYTSGPSLDTVLTKLQTSFNAIQHSFRGLQLLLNASKTICMLINRLMPARLVSLLWTVLT